jgi:hypothetical protein
VIIKIAPADFHPAAGARRIRRLRVMSLSEAAAIYEARLMVFGQQTVEHCAPLAEQGYTAASTAPYQ